MPDRLQLNVRQACHSKLIQNKLLNADGLSIDMVKLHTLMATAKLAPGSQAYLKYVAASGPENLKAAMLMHPGVLLLPFLD